MEFYEHTPNHILNEYERARLSAYCQFKDYKESKWFRFDMSAPLDRVTMDALIQQRSIVADQLYASGNLLLQLDTIGFLTEAKRVSREWDNMSHWQRLTDARTYARLAPGYNQAIIYEYIDALIAAQPAVTEFLFASGCVLATTFGPAAMSRSNNSAAKRCRKAPCKGSFALSL